MAESDAQRSVIIAVDAFDPWKSLAAYQTTHLTDGHFGATATFVGSMRDFNEGDAVSAMTLEYYPGMTEVQLQSIIDDAHRQWSLDDALIVHLSLIHI